VIAARRDVIEHNTLAPIKKTVRRLAPWLVPIYRSIYHKLVLRPRWNRMGMSVFSEHFHNNGWKCSESVSGTGSTLGQTEAIRAALPSLISELRVGSLLDIPCGDFNWMRVLDLPIHYVGADIVPELVALNSAFASERRSFVQLDISRDALPTVDMVLCRDCLVHFSYADIFSAFENLKRSGSKYLLTTTHPEATNRDIVTGEWRPINLQRPPFCLSQPLRLIEEHCPNPFAPDKCLGLWRVGELPASPRRR